MRRGPKGHGIGQLTNPSVLYYNNDDTRQPGSQGLAAGQQEMNDAQRLFAKFEAAVYLYELTGDATYRSFVEVELHVDRPELTDHRSGIRTDRKHFSIIPGCQIFRLKCELRSWRNS